MSIYTKQEELGFRLWYIIDDNSISNNTRLTKAKLYIQEGANLNVIIRGASIYSHAKCLNRDKELLLLLEQNGAKQHYLTKTELELLRDKTWVNNSWATMDVLSDRETLISIAKQGCVFRDNVIKQVIESGDKELAKLLIHHHIYSLPSSLETAIEYEYLDIVDLIVSYQCPSSPQELSDIISSCFINSNIRIDLVKILLKHGCKTHDYNDQNINHVPLYQAVKEKNNEMVELLLQHGADPDFVPNGCTPPIVKAVEIGDYESTMLLLDYGSKYKERAYKKALNLGNQNIATLIDKYRSPEDKEDKTEIEKELLNIKSRKKNILPMFLICTLLLIFILSIFFI